MQNECKSNANADQKQSNKTKLNNIKLNQNKKEDINNGFSALSGDDDFKIDFPLSKSGMDF